MSRYWQAGGREKAAVQLLNPQYRGTEEVFTPYSGFGAGETKWTQPQREALSAMMDNTVDALRRAILALKARIQLERAADKILLALGPLGIVAAFTSPEEARKAVLSGLNTLSNIVSRLDGPSRAEVLAGTLAPNKWLAGAQPVFDGVKGQAEILGELTLAGFVGERYDAAKKTIDEVLGMAGRAAQFYADYWPWIYGVGGVAGLYILWRVFKASPAGRVARAALSGHSKRHRRRGKKRLSWWEPEMKLEGYKR